jgi:sugar/nucleoside kinase (ribokinase family)
MKHFDVVTVGSALKDIMFYSNEITVTRARNKKVIEMEYGAKFPVDDVFVNYGGGAINVAVGLKNFGVDVSPLVCLGNDQVGKEIYAHLKKERIDTSLIQVNKKEKTGFSIVVSAAKDKEHTIFTHKGASNFLTMPNLRGFRTKWFYVSALSNKDWVTEFEKIVRQTKRGVKIAWNPGLMQLKDFKHIVPFLPAIEVLILNRDEAVKLLTDVNPRLAKCGSSDSRLLLSKLKALGAKNVIITQSARGVVAIDEAGLFHYFPAKAIQKRIVDTVGAGDSFGSGFLAAFLKWGNFSKALQLGIRNSAHNLYRVGAQNGLLKIKL